MRTFAFRLIRTLGNPGARLCCGGRAPSVMNLRCEYQVDPLGIDVPQPRLGWQLARPHAASCSARTRSRSPATPRRCGPDARSGTRAGSTPTAWPTWPTRRPRSIVAALPLAGARVGRQRRGVGVERARALGDGSAPAGRLEGPLDRGRPGTRTRDVAAVPDAAPRFTLKARPVGARLRHEPRPLRARDQRPARRRPGLHARAGPATTSGSQYQTYDVTALLRAGENAVGAMLGDGWYRGYLAWRDKRNVYGERLALLLQLADRVRRRAASRLVGTDAPGRRPPARSWRRTSTTARRYDARLERPGWSAPGLRRPRTGRRCGVARAGRGGR